MNNTFDWNRFCKVVNKDFRNIWPLFGTTLLIITVLPVALWLLFLVLDTDHSTSFDPNIRLLIVTSLPILAALMTPSRMYRTMNRRNEGIYFAMLPASKLEKFLSILIYSLIVCPLLVLLGGMVIDTLLWVLPFGCYDEGLFSADLSGMYSAIVESEFPNSALALLAVSSVVSNIASVMVFLFTATIFKRHKVLQTILWLCLIGFVLSIIGMPVMIGVFSSDNFSDWVHQLVDRGIDEVALANWISAISLVVNTVLALLFGWLSWRRLKKMPY